VWSSTLHFYWHKCLLLIVTLVEDDTWFKFRQGYQQSRVRISGRFLGAFANLLKVIISLVISVHLSVHPHGTTQLPLNEFSRKLIYKYFFKICQEIQASLKSEKNKRYFTWRPISIVHHILLNSS